VILQDLSLSRDEQIRRRRNWRTLERKGRTFHLDLEWHGDTLVSSGSSRWRACCSKRAVSSLQGRRHAVWKWQRNNRLRAFAHVNFFALPYPSASAPSSLFRGCIAPVIYRRAHSPRFNIVTLFYSFRWHNFGRARRYYIADSACFILSSSLRHAWKYVARSRGGRWPYACPHATFNLSVSRKAVFELIQLASADLMLAIWTIVTSASGQTNNFGRVPRSTVESFYHLSIQPKTK
jgi:hypothetical protein